MSIEYTATFCIALTLLLCAGNEIIHLMTNHKRQVLRIELMDWHGNMRYAEYYDFKVGSERSQYKLISIGKYWGNAGQYGTKTVIIVYPRSYELAYL